MHDDRPGALNLPEPVVAQLERVCLEQLVVHRELGIGGACLELALQEQRVAEDLGERREVVRERELRGHGVEEVY